MSSAFAGFEDGLFDFLDELVAHNERAWFKAHQARYEAMVREPARAFIRAMAPRLERTAPRWVADDRKVGGSLMRVHRDTRFSRDKAPYKTNVGIQFRHSAGKDVHAPGLYLHLASDEVFVGVGMWRPDGAALKAIRAAIDEQPDRWRGVVGAPAFQETWRRSTEDTLKRAPRGYDPRHPLVADLKLKSHMVLHELDHEQVLGPGLPARVEALLLRGVDFARFLCDAVELPF